jgi:uncharacterized membrane protein HdeD (DUF308 family)
MLLSLTPRVYFILIPIVLFLHEMEEWNIVKFHHENYEQQFNETNLSERLWLFMLSFIGLFFALVSLNIPDPLIANTVFLILVAFLLINGIQHILLSVILKKYNPGFLFGGLIGTFLGILYVITLIANDIVPLWLIAIIMLAEFIPATIDSVRSRKEDRLPTMITKILEFSNFVVRKLSE